MLRSIPERRDCRHITSSRSQIEWVVIVAEGDKLIAVRTGEYAQRAGQVAADLNGSLLALASEGDADHGGIEGAGGFLLGRVGKLRHVHKERLAVGVCDRGNDALGPGVPCGLEKDLKESKLAGLQFRKGANDADEGIKLAGRQGKHELGRQAEFDHKGVVSFASLPCAFEGVLAHLKNRLGKICLQLAANLGSVGGAGRKLRGDAAGNAKQLEGNRFAAKREVEEKLLKSLLGYVELGRQGSLKLND